MDGVPTGDRVAFERLGWHLWQSSTRMARLADAALADLGLTISGYGLLKMIDAAPGSSAADLARANPMTPQAVSKAVVRLESAGLLERRLPARHSRSVELHVTPLGRRRLGECVDRIEAAEAIIGSAIGGARYERLIADLQVLVTALVADPAPPPPPPAGH